ncbi:MAG: (d)CMP kinase [Bdellovibrionales bacterium]|nr:(d)CMP kinase [Bdellovibrionales bacterium]
MAYQNSSNGRALRAQDSSDPADGRGSRAPSAEDSLSRASLTRDRAVPFIVAIDGPGGSGKSSIARRIARELNLHVLDSGAVYRCVALQAQREGFTAKHVQRLLEGKLPETRPDHWGTKGSIEHLIRIAREIDVRFEYDLKNDHQTVFLGEEVVTKDIRHQDISTLTSFIAQVSEVRQALVQKQIDLAGTGCVAEGRDMAKIFPQAQVKIFLEADLVETAKRRVAQDAHIPLELVDKKSPLFRQTLKLLRERNKRDSKQMSKSGYDKRINTTGKTLDGSTRKIVPLVVAALDHYLSGSEED